MAEAGLPKPSAEDLAYAQARALKADPNAYAANVANASAARADINAMWAKLEAEQKQNAEAMSKMLEQIDTLKKQVDEAKKEGQRNLYTLVAAGMMVLGGLAVAFGRVMIGAGLLLSGVCIGAVPYLLDSPWFLPSVGGLFLVGLLLGGWHLYSGHIKADHNDPPESPSA